MLLYYCCYCYCQFYILTHTYHLLLLLLLLLLLQIKTMTEADAGLYRCTVDFGDSQRINADVKVSLQASPYFTDNITKTLTVRCLGCLAGF